MKLKAFQKYLQERDIDLAFFVYPDANITYFTQMKPSHAHLIITSETADFYLSKLDKKPTLNNITIKNLTANWSEKLSDKKIKRVGINHESITYQYYQKLKKIYPQADFVDISKILKLLRIQKTPEEVKKIEQACKITVTAFNSLVNKFSFKKFKTENDIAFFLEKYIRDQKAQLAFPTIVSTGKNSAIPHHVTSSTKLGKGFIQLDFGACYQNYCSDMSRMLYIGTISKKEKKDYDLLLQSQLAAVDDINHNKPFADLDKCARKYLGKRSANFIHSLGHGVGIDIHEQPTFRAEDGYKIAQMNIFTIEPGIYFPGKYGIRIEDTLVFDKKARILTNAPKSLFKLK